ncbi:MAG: hypothetical protein ABSG43_29755 [Solirubrobacteraceae bacterium]
MRSRWLSVWVIVPLLLGAIPLAIMALALGASVINLSQQTGQSCYTAGATVTYAGLTSGQQAFGSELAAKTGLDAGVISAWLYAEENGSAARARQWADNNDWLNVGYTDSGTFGAGDTVWSDPVSAADATAQWAAGQATVAGYGTADATIRAILTTAGQSPAVQITAIQASGWASSHYPDLPAIYTTVTTGSQTPVAVSLECVDTATGNYVDPLAHATRIAWERTDQGVDASMTVGSSLVALGTCQVKLIVDFYEGQPAIVCQLLDGSLQGDWWYIAEQVTPIVTVGQTVQAGQQIATYAPAGTAIETGWWQPHGGAPLGHYEGYSEGHATQAGADFRYLLDQLGAGAGSGAGLSTGTTLGTADYPGAGA